MPYLFPTPAMTGGMPDPPRGGRARGRRPVRLRHDDAGRPRHLGGSRALRQPARPRQPRWSVAAPRSPTRSAARPATTPRAAGFGGSCYLNNAAVAAETLLAHGPRPRRRGGRRRAPRQRHPGDLLGAPRRALRLGARRPGGRLVPPRRRVRRRGRCRSRRGRHPQPPAGRGHRRRRVARPPSRRWRTGSPASVCTALVVSLGVDAAADDPESPLLVTAEGYRGAGRALGGDRPADGGRPGGRLPPADPRRSRRGVPRRSRARLTGPVKSHLDQ